MIKKRNLKKIIHRINLLLVSRILIISYILFISIFALDTPIGIGFLIHLLPSLIFAGILILFWKFPKVAGILFAIAGAGTILVFNTYRDLFVLTIISLLPIFIGILFFFSKNPKH